HPPRPWAVRPGRPLAVWTSTASADELLLPCRAKDLSGPAVLRPDEQSGWLCRAVCHACPRVDASRAEPAGYACRGEGARLRAAGRLRLRDVPGCGVAIAARW